MAYAMKFYCRRTGDASAVAEMLKAGLSARYPGVGFQHYPPQPGACEFDVEAPTGGHLSVSVDVDSDLAASDVSELSQAPSGLADTKMIATVVASGAADSVLLTACWTTFVVDFDGIPWDEMDGFGVTHS